MSLYPLKFKPRLLEKMWGGRKIQTVLGKTLPADKPIGESWEIFDFPPGVVDPSGQWVSCEVANGPLAGKTLHELIGKFGKDLTGDARLAGEGQFPVLIKFLDAREDLSVQVHPDANYARTHPGAHLKSEAWYVVQADGGSRILKGLKRGATRESFAAALAKGTVEGQIQSIAAKAGDCYYLPSGTVHALGAGILAAEVQTPSDTTYRVFDFNRVDPSTGKQRTLHEQQALECIDFSGTPQAQKPKSHVASFFTTVSSLVDCEFFKMEKVRFSVGVQQPIPYDQPVVWMMLEGKARVKTDDVKEATEVGRGETVLLPAKMKNAVVSTESDCVWLEVTFPAASA